MNRSSLAGGIAFFDVDETLAATKTMVAFWEWWRAQGRADGTHDDAFAKAVAEQKPRDYLNRLYFRRYRGVPSRELAAAGRTWYADFRCQPERFIPPVLESLRKHRRRGHLIVLVSGSLPYVLEPIRRDVGADRLISARLEEDAQGVLTGEIDRPMIGPNKADAVRHTLEQLGISPKTAYAYGDHQSDLPMLSLVGNPTVVGDDPLLTRHAVQHGWSTMSPEGRHRVEIL